MAWDTKKAQDLPQKELIGANWKRRIVPKTAFFDSLAIYTTF
jgi:hypothetical protein